MSKRIKKVVRIKLALDEIGKLLKRKMVHKCVNGKTYRLKMTGPFDFA
jgi:uncharacterized protein YjhX (UPF0386 family)